MSFNIPIIFDDSPFFDWGDVRRSDGRRRYQNSAQRQPSVFGQWADPEFFYDYPAKKQHNRQNCRGRQAKMESEKQSKMPENRFEDQEGGIYDTEEHRRVRPAPRGNFGLDGWEIPVQYEDRPTRPHHKHKHTPNKKLFKTDQDIPNESPSSKQSQKKSNEASNNKEIPSNTEIKKEQGNNAEAMKIKTQKQSSKVIPEEDSMEQKFVEDPSTEASTRTEESQDNENIEIPIAYSPPKNARRQHSKRLSQCDPPSPADIKLTRIKSIVQKTEGIEEKITAFKDPIQNKNYLYISETLMKILLDLDTVDSEGFDNVRSARKEGVRTVQALVDKLENKLAGNKRNSKPE